MSLENFFSAFDDQEKKKQEALKAQKEKEDLKKKAISDFIDNSINFYNREISKEFDRIATKLRERFPVDYTKRLNPQNLNLSPAFGIQPFTNNTVIKTTLAMLPQDQIIAVHADLLINGQERNKFLAGKNENYLSLFQGPLDKLKSEDLEGFISKALSHFVLRK